MWRSWKWFGALLAAVAAVAGPGLAARAASVDLIWTATSGGGTPGGATLAALPGDVVTLTMRLTLGPGESLSVYFASIRFDEDLADELDLVSVQELSVPDLSIPGVLLEPLDAGPEATRESVLGVQSGYVLSCEAATLGAGITTPGTYDLCRFTFSATSQVFTGDIDVASGLFDPPLDGFVDDANVEFTPTFHGAGIDLRILAPSVPGPAGPWLGVLALLIAASAQPRPAPKISK